MGDHERTVTSANQVVLKFDGVEFRWRQEGCCLGICEAWDGGKMLARAEYRISGDLEHTVEVYQTDAEKKAGMR